MIKVDYDAMADKVVNECMRVTPGEVIQVSGDINAWEFIDLVQFHIQKVGAYPLLNISSEAGYRRRLNELPEEILSRVGVHEKALSEHVTGRIRVNSATNSKNDGISAARLKAFSQAANTTTDITKRNKARAIVASLPVPAMAEAVGMSFEEFHDLTWNAFMTDLPALQAECQRVLKAFGAAKDIHLTSAKGTDIHMSCASRSLRIDDAIYDEHDIANDYLITNIPCGEVYMAPMEETANGVAVFDEIYAMGKKIRDLRCVFENGAVTSFSSDKDDVEPFARMLDGHTGDTRMIAELGLGMNPAVTRPVGFIYLDEKIYGSCHIAIGDNFAYGGINRSSLHFDMIILEPTLVVDGTPIFTSGKVVA